MLFELFPRVRRKFILCTGPRRLRHLDKAANQKRATNWGFSRGKKEIKSSNSAIAWLDPPITVDSCWCWSWARCGGHGWQIPEGMIVVDYGTENWEVRGMGPLFR